MPSAYISVGSNISPEKNVKKAIILLSKNVFIKGISTFYKTLPFDRPGQPIFYNGVIQIETEASPQNLKYTLLRDIENKLYRRRTSDKSAPRTIDLDILIYEREVIHDNDLDIPDPDILARPFLALPLCELNPGLILPEWNRSIIEIAESLDCNEMKPLTKFTEILKRSIKNGYQKSGKIDKRAFN